MTVVAGTWFVLETTGSAAKVGLISAALAGFVIEGVGLRPTNLGMAAIYLAVTVMAKSDVNKTPEVDAYRIKLKHPFEAEVQALREVLKGVDSRLRSRSRGRRPVSVTRASIS